MFSLRFGSSHVSMLNCIYKILASEVKFDVKMTGPPTLAAKPPLAVAGPCSSNSYWLMSRIPVINQAVSNAWLEEQGFISVNALWCKARGYTAKRKGKASPSVPTR